MKQYILSLFTIAIFITGNAATTFTVDRVQYEVISEEDKTCKVIGYSWLNSSSQQRISVPDEVNGYTPIEIGNKAFYTTDSSYGISFVSLTNNIEILGKSLFARAFQASSPSFTVPTHLKLAKENAFGAMSNLTVYINDFEAWCRIDFENAKASPVGRSSNRPIVNGIEMVNIEIPNTISEVKQYVFSCFKPNSITFPSSINHIQGKVFEDDLKDIPTIKSVTSLSLIPPIMEDQIFNSTTLNDAPLYVPKTAIEAYKEAPYWKEFNNIVGIDIEAKGILLNKNALSLSIGQTEILEATVTPVNTTDPIRWSCSPENVATVVDGKVTALSSGIAVVTATCGFFTSQCTVMVSGESSDTPSNPGVNISDISAIIYMQPDEERLLSDLIKDGSPASWESSDEDVADVNKKGRVDAWEFGRCYITAKDSDGETIAVFEVFVCPTVSIEYSEGNSSYQHHVIYNSTPTVYIAAPENYEIVSITHDGEDITEEVINNEGNYQPKSPVTDNSVINVTLESTADAADLNGDGIIDVSDLNWLLERMMNQ